MPDATKCTCCSKDVELSKVVECCICKKLFYYSCVGVSSAEAKAIKSKRNLSWTCQHCITIGNDINAIKATLLELKQEIAELKARGNHQNQTEIIDENVIVAKVIYENNQREQRKSNVIMFNVEESAVTNEAERISEDRAKVEHVISNIPVEVSMNEVKVYRLGKYDENRPNARPIKVVLNNVSKAQKIISNAKNLRNNQDLKGIIVTSDKTKNEQQLYRNAKQKLQERLSSGENSLTIKFVEGVPVVVSKSSTSENQISPALH